MSITSCSSDGSDCTGDGDDSETFEDEDADALDSLQKINGDAFPSHSFQESESVILNAKVNNEGRKRWGRRWNFSNGCGR